MATKLVVDTCSIIDFFRFYYFDRDNGNQIYDSLNTFFLKKVRSKEIIILDKVFDEIDEVRYPEFKSLKRKIKPFKVGTAHLIGNVKNLIDTHFIKSNKKFFNNDPSRINQHMKKYEERYADLYLIEYCKELDSNGHDSYVVTDENQKMSGYQKLIPKIPVICNREGVDCFSLPYSLFDFYKDNLIFDLDIV